MPIIRLILICLVIFSITTANAAGNNTISPSPKDKCPVCGMFVSKYPDWVVSVTFKYSPAIFFDGAKDFFVYYHNIRKYTPERIQAGITTITVNDYYSLKPVDARQAYFVIGSDVYGPMGRELVPFKNKSDAQAFSRDHKGKKVLSFAEITPVVLKSLE